MYFSSQNATVYAFSDSAENMVSGFSHKMDAWFFRLLNLMKLNKTRCHGLTVILFTTNLKKNLKLYFVSLN